MRYIKESGKSLLHDWIGIVQRARIWIIVITAVLTGAAFNYTINNLPAGTYTVEVWHEEAGVQTESITVGDGETGKLDFSLQIKA